jgi:histone demethylase JARID1
MPGEYVLTFPGSFHAGFSTGLNIGEAVNFVSKSWIPYGLKCQEIYMNSREKIPVFPMDWLLIENALAIDTINVDYETKNILRKALSTILKEERKNRKILEEIANIKTMSNQGKRK